tara:strand:- start:18022 stop:19215 length:1194 start_codon:yes stop_codon:yes gene_type:complete
MKVAVIGSGIWGACTAYHLQKEGLDVDLYDMWGAGNSRSGSGGASRIIRLAYGEDKIYTELTNNSFQFWEELSNKSDRKLYHECGMLWLVSQDDSNYIKNSSKHIESCGHSMSSLSKNEVIKKYPHINLDDINEIYFEKKAGALFASRCCKSVVRNFKANGGKIYIGEVEINESNLDKNHIYFNNKKINADKYIIACGPWGRKLLPEMLGKSTYVSRQEVYYFSVPNNKAIEFDLNSMPCWLDLNENNPSYYGIPFHLNKGFKIAYDERSTLFDPDTSDRIPLPDLVKRTKSYLYHRFPKLKGLPISETRVCQYENSLDGNFIVNWHKKNNDILVLAGSSGHGFKLGPGLGELVKDVVLENKEIPEFFDIKRLGSNDKSSQYYNSQIKYNKRKRLFN